MNQMGRDLFTKRIKRDLYRLSFKEESVPAIQRTLKTVVLLFAVMWPGQQPSRAQTGPCATVVPGRALPDLIVDADRLKSDIVVTIENFSRHACAVVEGCVSSRGKHELLRFSSATPNIGQGDLVIGNPDDCPNLFEQSECHNHLHFHEYSDYRLWTDAGYQMWEALREAGAPTNTGYNAMLLANAVANGELIVGRKQGFCLIDIERYDPSASPQRKYTLCGGPGSPGNQGLQAGWSDVYGQQLDCQYIEIDQLKAGVYVLEDHVNPEQLLPESDYTNNTARVRFQYVPGRGKSAGEVTILED